MEKLVLQNAAVYDFHSFLAMFLVKRIHRETRAVVMVSPDRWQNAYLPESAVLQIFACAEAVSRYWHLLKARSGSYGVNVDIMAAYRNQLVKWAAQYIQMFWKWKWFDLVIRVMEGPGRLTNATAFAIVFLEDLSPMVNHVEKLLDIGKDIWPADAEPPRSGLVDKYPVLMWEDGSFRNWAAVTSESSPSALEDQ